MQIMALWRSTNSCMSFQQSAQLNSQRKPIPRGNYEVTKVCFSSIQDFVTVPFSFVSMCFPSPEQALFLFCVFQIPPWMKRSCFLRQYFMVLVAVIHAIVYIFIVTT